MFDIKVSIKFQNQQNPLNFLHRNWKHKTTNWHKLDPILQDGGITCNLALVIVSYDGKGEAYTEIVSPAPSK